MKTPLEKPFPPGKQGSDDLSFHLVRVHARYDEYLSRLLERFELASVVRPGMGAVLFELFENDDCIIKDLSEKLDTAPSTLTGVLRRMEKAGIIERHRDTADSRATRVRLTSLGRSLRPDCQKLTNEFNSQLVAGLSSAESATLKRLLAKVADNIQTGIAKEES